MSYWSKTVKTIPSNDKEPGQRCAYLGCIRSVGYVVQKDVDGSIEEEYLVCELHVNNERQGIIP